MNLQSIKTQLIIFLSVFALVLVVSQKNILLLGAMLLANAAALMTETFYSKIFKHDFVFSESAMITGLIIGFVLRVQEPWWVIVLTSFFAISSKYMIQFKGRHIFNPAAFGILFSLIVFKAQTQWLGTYLWFVLLPVGIYFIYRIRKVFLLVSYMVMALGLFGWQALAQGGNILSIFGYISYFFIFMMMIEPKTTPITLSGKIAFGLLLGGIIFLLTENGVRIDAELLALLVCNALVPGLNLLKLKKGVR